MRIIERHQVLRTVKTNHLFLLLGNQSATPNRPRNVIYQTGFICSDTEGWTDAHGTSPTEIEFSAAHGILVDTEGFSHVDYIKLFLTDDMIHVLVEQTNLFAAQHIAGRNISRRSRLQSTAVEAK